MPRSSLTPSDPSDVVETLGRIGYSVKGVVYALLGAVALDAAFSPTNPEGSSGLFQEIAGTSYGGVLLGVVAAGLASYALWRLTMATLNPADEDIGHRIAYVLSGVGYGGLAIQAGRLVLGSGSSSSDGTQERTQMLLSQPLGQVLVGIVAAGVAGYALYELHRAYSSTFTEKLNLGELNHTARQWAVRLARAGLASRGVTYLIIAFFLSQAALQSQSSEARGLDGALKTVQEQPFGPYLLAAVAIGLVGYGVYCWLNARYRTYE